MSLFDCAKEQVGFWQKPIWTIIFLYYTVRPIKNETENYRCSNINVIKL